MMARRHQPRRGVVLLVVLTLLTLLIVLGLTFTIISGHYRRAAEASAQGPVRRSAPNDCSTARCTNWSATPTMSIRSCARTACCATMYGESIRGVQVGNPVLIRWRGGSCCEFEAVFDGTCRDLASCR